MKNFNLKKSVLTLTLLASSAAVFAQTAATLQITNGFSFTEDAPLSFGTIRANQDLDNGSVTTGAGLTLTPVVGGSATVSEFGAVALTGDGEQVSTATSLIAGTAAQYTISGAAPGARMNITVPEEFQLTGDGVTAFDVNIVNGNVIIASGPNASVPYDGSNAETDGTGAVTFLVGGTITIDQAITAPIEDGDYTGTYDITVSY